LFIQKNNKTIYGIEIEAWNDIMEG